MNFLPNCTKCFWIHFRYWGLCCIAPMYKHGSCPRGAYSGAENAHRRWSLPAGRKSATKEETSVWDGGGEGGLSLGGGGGVLEKVLLRKGCLSQDSSNVFIFLTSTTVSWYNMCWRKYVWQTYDLVVVLYIQMPIFPFRGNQFKLKRQPADLKTILSKWECNWYSNIPRIVNLGHDWLKPGKCVWGKGDEKGEGPPGREGSRARVEITKWRNRKARQKVPSMWLSHILLHSFTNHQSPVV